METIKNYKNAEEAKESFNCRAFLDSCSCEFEQKRTEWKLARLGAILYREGSVLKEMQDDIAYHMEIPGYGGYADCAYRSMLMYIDELRNPKQPMTTALFFRDKSVTFEMLYTLLSKEILLRYHESDRKDFNSMHYNLCNAEFLTLHYNYDDILQKIPSKDSFRAYMLTANETEKLKQTRG